MRGRFGGSYRIVGFSRRGSHLEPAYDAVTAGTLEDEEMREEAQDLRDFPERTWRRSR